MNTLNELSNVMLVDMLCAADAEKKKLETETKQYQAELQRRGLKVLEDRNIKQTEFFGNDNNKADVTYSQMLDILNYFNLKEICGDVLDDYVQRVPEIKYTVKPRFKEVLTAIFTGDYDKNVTVEDVIEHSGDLQVLDAKQKSLLLKKLKGDYKKDKATILAVLGKASNEVDIDEELYFIDKAKKWEKIKAFFDCGDLEAKLFLIRKCILVESTVKIGVKYEDAEETA